MRKQLLISLLLYTTLTTSTINAASSADEFFKNVKRANISQLFNDSAPNVKDEIYRRVTNSKTAEGLGVNVMLFAPLKENADILKYSPSTSANTTTAVGTLGSERLDMKSNATGAHKVTRAIGAIGAVDSSPFTQAENAARLEAARKAEEQKLLHEHQSTKDAITAPEANERDNLKKAFSQSALQVSELHERIANSNEEQSARSALVDAHTQSLAEAKKAEAQRKQTELFNAKLANLENAESTDRATIADDASLEKFKSKYDQSLAEAQKAEEQRKQTELFNAKLDDLQKNETAKRIEMENAAQHSNLQDKYDQSLAEAKNAEAKRKQTELFNAKFEELQNQETKDREIEFSAENSERNELSRRFQTEKSRLEEEQRKKAEQLQEDNRRRALAAIEDAERDAEKSMGAILQNELNELTNLHRQIALQLENLTLEAAKRKRLEEKKQEIETLTEKVTITQRDLKDTDESIFLVANEAIGIMLKTYRGNHVKIKEIERFRNAIQTNDINKIERTLRTLQDFSDRGMIQAAEGSRTTASNMFSGFITWYSQKVHMTDELRRNINQLKRELN